MRVKIKLARRHPQDFMYFGRFTISYQDQELDLNEKETCDLKNAGPKHWFKFSVLSSKKKAGKRVNQEDK